MGGRRTVVRLEWCRVAGGGADRHLFSGYSIASCWQKVTDASNGHCPSSSPAMFACSMHWLARPLLFTHLLTLIFAWQLRWFTQERVPVRRLFVLLPPLMVLWANLHGAFPTGLVLIAMYAVGNPIDTWRQSKPLAKSKQLASHCS